ncbi:MAG: hypothetical protein FIA97_03420 [Methylococcaceae bacterium]|nr:hypothetical protein [Methylococcaceae bacterium]
MKIQVRRDYLRFTLMLSSLVAFHLGEAQAAPLGLSSAIWSAKKGELTIRGKLAKAAEGASVDLYDINGRRLGSPALSAKGSFSLRIAGDELVGVPCAVRAQSGDLDKVKPVAGAPKFCKQTPRCQITAPGADFATPVNTPVQFTASVQLPKSINNPKYEWDFAGGAMGEELTDTGLVKTYKRPDSLEASVAFVRDNSRYRVRFVVTDGDANLSMGSPQYRCEDSVEIVVGTAPDVPPGVAPMAADALSSTPKKGSEANGEAGDLVVLPFQDWTMQHAQDGFMPRLVNFSPQNWLVNNLNAYVIKKGSVGVTEGPLLQAGDTLQLRYSAAVNAADPTGNLSINSTSQNWPLASDIKQFSPLLSATIQKSDWWETVSHLPADQTGLAKNFVDTSLIQSYYEWLSIMCTQTPGMPKPDEGYFLYTQEDITRCDWSDAFGPNDNAQTNLDGEKSIAATVRSHLPDGANHGTYMPGVSQPYVANEPQTFTLFDAINQWFVAQTLPITDIDDAGRVNSQPLVRIEAVQTGSTTALASTDVNLPTSRDLHCRGCHAKGQIAANPATPYVAGSGNTNAPGGADDVGDKLPTFYDLQDLAKANPDLHVDPNSKSLFDQEFAANINVLVSHSFLWAWCTPWCLELGITGGNYGGPLIGDSSPPLNFFSGPIPCNRCHVTEINPAIPYTNGPLVIGFSDEELGKWTGGDGASYSRSMHNFHGRLQYNADKSDIQRDNIGRPVRFDAASLTQRPANADPNPNTLFPIFGEDGKQLPMEQNCLRCHAGHREPLYNDRMYTAGVTCYDCHGDMLAVGKAWTKEPAKQGSEHLEDYRFPWMDETDCGSCHIGNANLSKTDTAQYFSPGVRRRAFDDTNLAAVTRPVDKADPDAVRFAVVPNHEYQYKDNTTTSPTSAVPLKVELPVYRFGKDQHGQVACAACHGAAHEVAPSRDPSANANVTAVQLQGYPGHILECNVCHTTDAFKDLENLDGSTASGLPAGVLGGPHNLHPVNAPNWYLQRTSGDQLNTDGTQYGGWHNVVAGLPGVKNEDQCAACHGDDHKGTRLSRTPVDRVFDFRGLKFKKLKKVGFKNKVIKVAAGSIIGCDTCHDLKTSNTKLPGGEITHRHSPVIAASPSPTATIALPFAGYHDQASDEDVGAQLTYTLLQGPDGMSIDNDQHKGLISWDHTFANPDDVFDFQVQVTDKAGLSASRWFVIKPVCPSAAPFWDAGLSVCSPLQITSAVPTGGVHEGATFSYPLTSTSPASYSVIDAATGQAPTFTPVVSVDGNGLLAWTPDATTPDSVSFRILASAKDNPSHQASQDITLAVCRGTQDWHPNMGMCMDNTVPKVTTTPAPKGLTAGAEYRYDVNASDPDFDSLTYSLRQAPAGMAIDAATGIITWKAAATVSGEVSFTAEVSDGFSTATQTGKVTVCVSPQHWDTGMQMCM